MEAIMKTIIICIGQLFLSGVILTLPLPIINLFIEDFCSSKTTINFWIFVKKLLCFPIKLSLVAGLLWSIAVVWMLIMKQ